MKRKIICKIPTLLTLSNMFLGLLVIFHMINTVSERDRRLACLLILLAAFFDAIDGTIARRLDAVSALGKELDSFADLISFGVAPLTIYCNINTWLLSPLSFLIFALFPVAGAFRLARYNLGEYSHHFEGLPIPAAGVTLVLSYLALSFLKIEFTHLLVHCIRVLILLLSIFMVSRIRVRRFCSRRKV